MYSQSEKQAMTVHILRNISKSKSKNRASIYIYLYINILAYIKVLY